MPKNSYFGFYTLLKLQQMKPYSILSVSSYIKENVISLNKWIKLWNEEEKEIELKCIRSKTQESLSEYKKHFCWKEKNFI
jgi:hypothetical protein